MWQQITEGNLPDDLAAMTSSIWQYDELVRVGVMKSTSMLMPPHLWAEVYQSDVKALRQSRNMLDELQQMLHLPIVYAEVPSSNRHNLHFLRFIGFTDVAQEDNITLFKRTI